MKFYLNVTIYKIITKCWLLYTPYLFLTNICFGSSIFRYLSYKAKGELRQNLENQRNHFLIILGQFYMFSYRIAYF